MMNSFVRRILTFSPLLRDLAVSATGCFVLVRGFRFAATAKEGSSDHAAGTPRKQFADIGIALFLLAFIAMEMLAAIGMLRR